MATWKRSLFFLLAAALVLAGACQAPLNDKSTQPVNRNIRFGMPAPAGRERRCLPDRSLAVRPQL